METTSAHLKLLAILALTAVVTILHYSTGQDNMALHILHRELYTVPILLASFWFGLWIGLSVSVVISAIYAAYILTGHAAHGSMLAIFTQIVFFNLIALVLGWSADRQRKQQSDLLHAEKLAVLGRAATAVGYEMRDILNSLKRLSESSAGTAGDEADKNEAFQLEIERLEDLVENLSTYVPPEQFQTLSTDLNEIIRQRIEHHWSRLREAQISLHSNLDENGCTSRVNVEKIGWVLDQLIGNAIELSSPGDKIEVHSERAATHCRIAVRDQGPGIRPEHMRKMFQPFFTTTGQGTGLSLACSKKILDDMGGDITVSSEWGKGATFTLIIPKETPPQSFRDKVISQGQKTA